MCAERYKPYERIIKNEMLIKNIVMASAHIQESGLGNGLVSIRGLAMTGMLILPMCIRAELQERGGPGHNTNQNVQVLSLWANWIRLQHP